MSTGFSFGQQKPQASSGFAFAQPVPGTGGPFATQTTKSGGFFGGTTTTTQSAGLTFGQPTTTTSGITLTGLLGQPTTTSAGGFGLPAPQTQAGGFALTTPQTQAGGFGATPQTQAAGFRLPTPQTQAGNFALATASTATSAPLFGGASGAATTPALGLTMGKPATTATPALGFGQKPGTTTTTAATGFNLAKPAVTTSLSFGAKPAGTTTTGGFGLGGTFGMTGATTSTAGSIFGTTQVKPASTGLGGVDPKTATTSSSGSGTGSKTSDGKALKELNMPDFMVMDVDNFQKFVKEEKTEMENIKRMSSTPMVKVQEDTAALKQLLSVVSNGLQRNANAVEKLKQEMTQELKNAEMAQRTKDIPPGLQYENTAPTEYFQKLVEDFETQMISYRQQIEMLENHLAALHQPNRLTAEELITLLKKLHEAFLAIAAQLHQVHEAVKTQKEHYLNYRKIFQGDTKNIFERQKKAPVKIVPPKHTDHLGPSPFPTMTNAAAVAMATALNRSQQPQTQATGGPPVTGFAMGGQSFGVPVTTTTGFTGFTGTNFGTPSATAAVKPIGLGTGSNLFASTSASGSLGFGQSSTGSSNFNLNSAPTGLGTPQQPTISAATEQPFQLNKPPLGSKRGKR